MKRTLSLSLLLLSGAWLYACSSDDSSTSNPTQQASADSGADSDGDTTDRDATTDPGTDDGGPVVSDDAGPGSDDDAGDLDASTDDAEADGGAGGNPIATPAATLFHAVDNNWIDGVQWSGGALYATLPLNNPPVILRFIGTKPTEFQKFGGGAPSPLGITFDEKAGKLLFASAVGATGELFRLTASTADPVPVQAPAKITLKSDAGTGIDSPNDVVVRKSDGTIYVTDPGYQSGSFNNGVYRVSPTGDLTTVATFEGSRPNGIALSPTANLLYVSLTEDPGADGGPDSVIPTIVKYEVKADGSTGAGSKFVDLPPVTAGPDGIAVDTTGNVYATTAAGVVVFSPAGTKYGTITVPKRATNLTFGGDDGKTLFISTEHGIYSAKVKVAGLTQ